MKVSLGQWSLDLGYVSAAIRGRGGNFMSAGSSNAMTTGTNLTRAFRGVTALVAKVGSRIMFLADGSYAGLGTATTAGTGSVFSVRQLLLYIGAGQVSFAGLALSGLVASSTLSLVKKSGGVYAAGSLTGPFQAGHAQPSAPTAYAKSSPSSGKTPMSGTVSVVVWRVSSITGQVSLASLPSNVVSLSNQSVIVQMPLPDSNGQDYWGIGVPKVEFADLGVFYELPTSLGGEVAESTLSYTRSVGSASIADTTNIVDAAGAAFTSADIGRRLSFGAYDSWIVSINSATQAVMNDTNSSGGTITASGTITHAVAGYTRSVEISWTNGALLKQPIVPTKAFPPPAGQFAGAMNDVLWLEADGIIYVGEPGHIGSFPPTNALFPNEPAVHYLRFGDGLTLRFGRTSWGALAYVGGSPALEYQTLSENEGILYPQNVGLGASNRLLMWIGQPAVVASGVEPDIEFAQKVMPDFAGWDEGQTANAPICPGYDGRGKYEVWCWQKKVMAYHVPSGAWCAPIDLTGKVSGNVVAAVTHDKKLYLSCSDGVTLTLYQFDVGSGSVMVIQTSDVRPNGYGATVSEILIQGRVDNTANPVRVDVIRNFNDSSPINVRNTAPTATGIQDFPVNPPNVLGARQHALRITMTSTGGDTGIDYLESKGELNEVRAA